MNLNKIYYLSDVYLFLSTQKFVNVHSIKKRERKGSNCIPSQFFKCLNIFNETIKIRSFSNDFVNLWNKPCQGKKFYLCTGSTADAGQRYRVMPKHIASPGKTMSAQVGSFRADSSASGTGPLSGLKPPTYGHTPCRSRHCLPPIDTQDICHLHKILQIDTSTCCNAAKTSLKLRTIVLFCANLLSPPPSEKVDLPRTARLGAFFLGRYHRCSPF
jgi:hypothetical protein